MLLLALTAGFSLAGAADASPYARYGVQDDAWLLYGPDTVSGRIDALDALGVDLVRFTLDWSTIEKQRCDRDWASADLALQGLHARRIGALVTLYGAPRWANGGRTSNWAPTSGSTFAAFAAAAAKRYPWVKQWAI